ncbi:hypothetical protein CHELA20_51221 [Hyphomicrobiales bacterium]|nr:hypothetical protein CHELA41_23792 [Hyphomicrobiales bacterium]CAH1674529.1 hypothetical protein CHELA20_51221 [Hyphomicrobiales bacterium]
MALPGLLRDWPCLGSSRGAFCAAAGVAAEAPMSNAAAAALTAKRDAMGWPNVHSPDRRMTGVCFVRLMAVLISSGSIGCMGVLIHPVSREWGRVVTFEPALTADCETPYRCARRISPKWNRILRP